MPSVTRPSSSCRSKLRATLADRSPPCLTRSKTSSMRFSGSLAGAHDGPVDGRPNIETDDGQPVDPRSDAAVIPEQDQCGIGQWRMKNAGYDQPLAGYGGDGGNDKREGEEAGQGLGPFRSREDHREQENLRGHKNGRRDEFADQRPVHKTVTRYFGHGDDVDTKRQKK